MLLLATRHPVYGQFIRGRLALARIDSRADVSTYVDAVWAILLEAPMDRLDKMNDNMILAEARADPEKARETWGIRPEHLAGARMAEQQGLNPGR